MSFSEQIIHVNGRAVRYYEAGEPHHRTILLLHGGFGDARLHWSEVMSALADDYHLIAPDLPGYGESDPLPNMMLDDLLKWTEDLLEALGLDQAAVVGHSFGGLVARLLAAQRPQVVPVVILVDGGVIPQVPQFARFLGRLPLLGPFLYGRLSKSTTSRSSLESAVHTEGVVNDEFVKSVQANDDAHAAIMRAVAVSPIPESKTPRVPVLILWGEEDSVTPLRAGESIQKAIPGAQLSSIADCGHMPQVEVPDVFTWQIRNFFDKLDRSRG